MSPVAWPGEWLWPSHGRAVGATVFHEPRQSNDPDRNGFVRFRGRVDLAAPPARATLWLSADGRYLASVNEHRLGRGPAASDADVREIDPYEVSPFLVVGANVVTVIVHSYGVDTAWYARPTTLVHSGRGGGALYAHLDIDGRLALASPAEWRCERAADWARDTPRVNDALGYVEVRDVRLEPPGWESTTFDDSHWNAPEPCAPDAPALPGRTYFPVLHARALPLLRAREAAPRSWVALEVSDKAPPDPGEILARAHDEHPLSITRSELDAVPGQPLAGRPLRIRTADGFAVRLVFDFGELVAARPRIAVDGYAGAVIDIATAERIDELGQPVIDLFGSRHGHRFVLRSGPQILERWEWIGFRHLFVTIRGAHEPIVIRSVVAISSEDPTPRLGDFSCSDDVLTGVWRAGAHTVHLVATDLIHGDVAREQRQWVGDAQAALGALLATTGGAPLARHALQLIAEAQPFGEFLPMYTPGDYRAVGTTIPDFTLRWLLAVDEFHRWSGDASFVAELFPTILRSIRAFDPFVDETGLVADVPYWHFIDWAAVGRDGAAGPINGLYILALEAVGRLAAAVGDAREAARLRRSASRARSAMRARLRVRRGLFGDTPAGPFSQHTNALAILCGAASPRSVPRIAAAIGDDSRLRVTATGRIVPIEDAAADYDARRHIVIAQPGFMGFVLRALAVARREDLALQLIRDRWGPMAPSGTCWETWSGRQSRCHPWATAPTAELPRMVLGVAPTMPGWTKLRIDPYVGDLTWARGRVPIPHGVIGVSWIRDDAGVALEVDLPDGVVAELRDGELLGAGTHVRRLAVPPP
jgi:alpha-L-rhamnosidase